MSNSAFTPTVLQDFREASVSQSGVVNTTTQSFAGVKTFDGIELPTTGGTATTLDHYEEGTFQLNFNSGMCTDSTYVDCNFIRVGKMVTIWLPQTLVTATDTDPTWTVSVPVPARLVPWHASYWPTILLNNNVQEAGQYMYIGTSGEVTFKRNTDWVSGTTNCGFEATSFTYLITI